MSRKTGQLFLMDDVSIDCKVIMESCLKNRPSVVITVVDVASGYLVPGQNKDKKK